MPPGRYPELTPTPGDAMADDIDYSQYAGRVAFPRGNQDLLSTTHCPACFTPLTSTVCAACRLDLGHPDAARLYTASVAAAGSLDERIAIIGRIRYETGQASASAPAAAPAVSIRESAPAALLLDRREGRRSSVQVTLLVVGVSLLSVAAIFFLVYAFLNFGIVWRSVIIGAITVAAFLVASLLRRRNLTATAEGIAVFAVVLVYLDVWAIRENDLFGARATDATLYWGVALLLAAIGFIAWHRASGLRVANITGFATFAPAVGVLVSGIAEPHMTAINQGFLTATAVAVAGLIHPLARHGGRPARPERVIVLATTVLALLGAFLLSTRIYERFEWATAIGGIGLAVLAGAHLALLLRSPSATSTVFGHILASFAGLSAASAVGLTILRGGHEDTRFIAPAVAAAVVALLLEFGFRRVAGSKLRPFAATAAIGAGTIAGIALLPALLVAFGRVLEAAGSGIRDLWSLAVTDPVAVQGVGGEWPILALAVVGVLASLAWWVGRALPARAPVIAWWAGIVLVLSVPSLHLLWLEFGAWMLLAVVSLAALLLLRSREGTARYRPALLATMIAAALLGYALGWATTSTWWIGTLVVIGLLVASRPLVRRPGAKAALLGTGIGIALLSVGSIADQLNLDDGSGLSVRLADHFVLTAIAAVVVLLGSAIPAGLASSTDRRVEFWVSGAASALSLPLATVLVTTLSSGDRQSLLLPEYGTNLATALVLLVALVLWLALRGNRAMRAERIVASIAATPALYLALSAFVRLLGLPEFVATVVPVTAALLAAAGSLTVTLLRPTSAPRWARELGVALVGVPAVVSAVRSDDGLAWLVLLIAAVAVLLLAIDREGLFTSRSARHHLGWLALVLATAGLWWRLSGDRVTALEPYVVPLSVVLLAVAALITLTAGHEQPPRDSKAGPLVALGAILVTLLPLGVNSATGPGTPALWIFAISALLLLAGSAITGSPRWQWNADAAALGGAIGVVVVSVGRAIFLPAGDLERDGWLAAVFLALMVAAFLQARTRPPGTRPAGDERLRSIASQSLGIIAMAALLALEIPAFREEPGGGIRAIALILLFSALHVIAFLVSGPPLTRLVALVAIVFAAIAGIAAEAFDALGIVEFASIPIALALLATGLTELRAVPAARSWTWLAPGTAVLLVTSLLATIDDRPLWRLVGLGVAGIAVVVLAVVRRLQAPFAIGVVVVLIHGIATFLPQLRAAYEALPWWLWLGAGGVLLIVLAARYEQRIRNLKSVAMRFAALR